MEWLTQKIKALTRSLDNHAPARLGDAAPVQRNLDPNMHPFEKPREYTRAMNAAKLDRLFAKPFVAALDGHIDGIYSLARHPKRLDVMASGSGDGGTCVCSPRNPPVGSEPPPLRLYVPPRARGHYPVAVHLAADV